MEEFAIIISGFGGQGILSAGRLVATAAMIEGKEVSWLPSYGPEMRGGTANCVVVISDDPIGSPLVNRYDILIALNKPSLERFTPFVKPKGTIIYDASLIDHPPNRSDVDSCAISASDIASKMGNMTYAGIILLGSLSASHPFFTKESFEKSLYNVLPEKKHRMIPEEMNAFMQGMQFTV
jgi:2-oxoglutarate ferredoxin oxidoreductase subunit gamma